MNCMVEKCTVISVLWRPKDREEVDFSDVLSGPEVVHEEDLRLLSCSHTGINEFVCRTVGLTRQPTVSRAGNLVTDKQQLVDFSRWRCCTHLTELRTAIRQL